MKIQMKLKSLLKEIRVIYHLERSLVLVLGIFLQLVFTVSPSLDHFSYSVFIYKSISSHWNMNINIYLKPYWNMYATVHVFSWGSFQLPTGFPKIKASSMILALHCVCVHAYIHFHTDIIFIFIIKVSNKWSGFTSSGAECSGPSHLVGQDIFTIFLQHHNSKASISLFSLSCLFTFHSHRFKKGKPIALHMHVLIFRMIYSIGILIFFF